MGKSETSTASIGIKILLSDLISQINEATFELICTMLYNGFIEDENDYYNQVYNEVVNFKLPETWLEYKEYLETNFKKYGSYNKSKFSSEVHHTIEDGCLFDKYLLVPIKEILSSTRWGYDREGTNSNSRPIDFDLSVATDEYKELEKYNIVFIVHHHSC
jgi:hypothetical protein